MNKGKSILRFISEIEAESYKMIETPNTEERPRAKFFNTQEHNLNLFIIFFFQNHQYLN